MYSLHLRRHPFPHYSGDISGSFFDSHEKLRLVVKGGQAVRFRKIHAGRIIGRTDTVCGLTFTVIHLDRRECPFNVFSESGLLAPCRIMVDCEHVAVQPVTGYLPTAVERRPVPAKPVNQIPQPPFSKIVLYSTSAQFGMAYLLSLLTI